MTELSSSESGGTATVAFRNPYRDAFDKYVMQAEDAFRPSREWDYRTNWRLADGYDGPEWNRHLSDTLNTHMAREELVTRFAWSVPTEDAIQAIVDLGRPIIEIGAGTGYWAWLLEQAGAEILPFDQAPDGNVWACEQWTTVYPGDHRTLAEFHRWNGREHALLLAWPPYADRIALDCLDAFRGDTLVYIGEPEGGCCATDDFFRQLPGSHWDDEVDGMVERRSGWRVLQEIALPQWPGMHDYLTIYRR